MEPLHVSASNAVWRALSQQPASAGKVKFAWQLAAGPALSRAGVPRWSENGTLRIRAKSQEWKREIERARPLLRDRLSQMLGPDVVTRIVVEG